jgi:uncharacterized protein
MTDKIRIIDAHTHPFGNRGLDLSPHIKSVRDPILMRRRNPEVFREMLKGTDDLTEDLIATMDKHGVAKALIQSRGVGTNEDVAKAVKKHPERLAGLYRPLYNNKIQGPQDPIDWAELARNVDYWIGELKLKGMGEIRVGRFTSESAPDRIAKDFVPLFEILARHKSPIMFQTAWTQFGTPIYHGTPLFLDVLAESFPEVPIVITKMGRGYDYLFEMCLIVAFKHDNVYLDTVQSKPAHVKKAVEEIGPERVIWGTDWEQTWAALKTPEGDLYTRSLAIVNEAGLSEEQKAWVFGKTAAKLWGI